MREIFNIAKKEFNGFFASPAAFLFLGAFLLVILFIFFWVETFFARNIADVRPLFQWMPVLLIFLAASLTMRSWSEERRAGTLETLLTSSVGPVQLVLGKFLAGLALVGVALVLTLPLPITVSILGPLDWGTVVGGYVATPFLAAAYVAIGLCMSARTDNPIVAWILTTLVCAVFYLIGTPALTNLFGYGPAGFLALLGTGSRFESITRGVLDLRDLYYYISIVGVFLSINLYNLERLRWVGNPRTAAHRRWGWLMGLAVANFIAGNFWLTPVLWARADITQGHMYSLSNATKDYLGELQEPLLIRGYFSAKTHPLLAPLVPQLKDLLKEYAIAGRGKVRVEFVDPHEDQALEQEAATRYDIKPVPFEMASRYQAAVVNSYFNILLSYGEQYEVLGIRDLVDVKRRAEEHFDVILKNPEYEITRSIRKVIDAYQNGGNPFDTLSSPVKFTGYISANDRLPEQLVKLRADLEESLKTFTQQGGNKFSVEFQDPDANDGAVGKEINRRFGFSPQVVGNTYPPKPFWFYMMLQSGSRRVQIPLPGDLSKEVLQKALDSGIRRLAPGFLKTIVMFEPSPDAAGGKTYRELTGALSENANIQTTDLKSGRVTGDADLLMVLAPNKLDDKQLFAVDQYLMQGGSVVMATSPIDVEVGKSLDAVRHKSGVVDWLRSQGLTISNSMVLDPQNASLPVPVEHYMGALPVQEIRMMPYPHFPDIRGKGLNEENPITASLGQLTLNWVSAITVDRDKNKDRQVVELVHSSPESWNSNDLNILPNYTAYPKSGFVEGDDHGAQLLAVAVEGQFDSYFKGKASPLAAPAPQPPSAADAKSASGDKGKQGDSASKDDKAKPTAAGASAQQKKDVPDNGKHGEQAKTDASKDADAAKPDDTASKETGKDNADKSQPAAGESGVTSIVERSPATARIILVSSNTFGTDAAMELASEGYGSRYTKAIEFLQNAVDWSLEDRSLLAIRSRAQFARTLRPMEHSKQLFWEYLNYALAVVGLLCVWLWRWSVRRANEKRYQSVLAEV